MDDTHDLVANSGDWTNGFTEKNGNAAATAIAQTDRVASLGYGIDDPAAAERARLALAVDQQQYENSARAAATGALLDRLTSDPGVKRLMEAIADPNVVARSADTKGERALLVAPRLALTESGFVMVEESSKSPGLFGSATKHQRSFSDVTMADLERMPKVTPEAIEAGIAGLLERLAAQPNGEALNGDYTWKTAGKWKEYDPGY